MDAFACVCYINPISCLFVLWRSPVCCFWSGRHAQDARAGRGVQRVQQRAGTCAAYAELLCSRQQTVKWVWVDSSVVERW